MLPTLAKVPPVPVSELTIKATANGIIVLKQNKFRTRYTGNKYSAVDINGNLWLKASELKKEIAGPKLPKKKKKPQVETQGVKNVQAYEAQISDNLSTSSQTVSTIPPELSTKKPRPDRTYTVHKREVRQRILGYINTKRGKKELYFWTVTFPEGIPDDVAYRVYNIWLTSLRQRKMLREYLWVVERQKNGTLHFHIAIPHKMPVQRANAMMRGTLKNEIKKGNIQGYSVYKANRYNGVDIAKNRKTGRVVNFAIKKGSRSLSGYLTKYVTKNDTAFTHLAWHNSRGFSSLFTGVTFTEAEFVAFGFHTMIDRRKRFGDDFFWFVPWIDEPPDLITEHLYQLNSYLQDAFENLN